MDNLLCTELLAGFLRDGVKSIFQEILVTSVVALYLTLVIISVICRLLVEVSMAHLKV